MALLVNPLGVEIGAVYTIVGPDGTNAVFNNPAHADYVGVLDGEDGVTGLERAGVRQSTDPLAEADGGVHGTFRYDPIAFTIKGLIDDSPATSSGLYTGLPEATVRAQRIARLLRATDAMAADGSLIWTPSTAPAVRLNFRQQQPTRISGRRPKRFLIAGIAETAVVEALVAGTAFASAAYIEGPPPPEGGAGVFYWRAQVAAVNGGRSNAWPTITVNGPIVNPIIRNETTGREIRLTATIASGGALTLHTEPRKRAIIDAAGVNQYGTLNFALSTWFALAPGTNTIIVKSATSTESGNGSSVSVSWRDSYG